MTDTILRDVLGNLQPIADISEVGSKYGQPSTGGRFGLHSIAADLPHRRWDYTSKDVSDIVAEMDADGWDCKVGKDGYGAPRIVCTHRATQAALEAEQAAKVELVGKPVQGFVRFGKLPKSGRSTNWATGELEPGVSVYRATFYDNGYVIDTPHYSTGSYAQFVLTGAQLYRVWGEVIGYGSDGEPCLKVTKTKKI